MNLQLVEEYTARIEQQGHQLGRWGGSLPADWKTRKRDECLVARCARCGGVQTLRMRYPQLRKVEPEGDLYLTPCPNGVFDE